MDFTNNLSQIAGKLTADLTERTREKKEERAYDDPQGIYSPRLSWSFHRVLSFQNNPRPPFQTTLQQSPPPPIRSPFQMY